MKFDQKQCGIFDKIGIKTIIWGCKKWNLSGKL